MFSAKRSRRNGRRSEKSHFVRLLLEALEDRRLLSATGWLESSANSASVHNDFVAGELIIGFEGDVVSTYHGKGAGPAISSARQLLREFGVQAGKVLLDIPAVVNGRERLTTHWTLADGADVLDVSQRLASHPGIAYAEPNYLYSIDATPLDPRYDELWGLNNTGQTGGTADADIDAPEAWDIATGTDEIVVGVIDTGIDYNHEDLRDNVWVNPVECPAVTVGSCISDGVDDDGNGYVDDFYGWDFINDDNDPFDDNGHGTHTSGTIGAVGNNGIGVAGVNWNVDIMGLKFLGSGGGGSTEDAIEAVNYSTMMRNLYATSGGTAGANIRLTSNSWGGGGFSQALMDAIAASGAADMLFVASAGNGNTDADVNPSYPAAYDLDNIISVAATDHNDDRASFSNWGATSVDLAAPGVSVLSTTPGDTYSSFNGTSMAAPHVAGAAALAWGVAPAEPYTGIRDAIYHSVDPIASMDASQGSTTSVATGGRLNAFGMLQQLGMIASPVSPAAGSVFVAPDPDTPTPPTVFVVRFSYPVDASTLHADGTGDSDFRVNSFWADSYDWHGDDAVDPDPYTVTYSFLSSPVSDEGVQQMHMPAAAVQSSEVLPGGNDLREMNATFRYDARLMEVDAITPPDGSVLTLPFTKSAPQLLTIDFNEPYRLTSLGVDDLMLNDGFVKSAAPVEGDEDTVEYAIEGVTQEGTLAVQMRAGALTDVHGNPMAAYSTSFELDWDTVEFPTPLAAVSPRGSLVYDGSVSGFVGRPDNGTRPDDTDSFTLDVDPNQTITVIVEPDAGLAPMVSLSDITGPRASASASAGATAMFQTVGNTSATTETYTITVGGDGATAGAYTLSVFLNTAMEDEGAGNDSYLDAQDLEASFIALNDGAGRGAVFGTIEDNGCAGPDAFGYEACRVPFEWSDISETGTPILTTTEDDDEEVLLRRKDLSGFQFSFYGQTYDQIIIGGNGQLTFEWDRRSGSVRNNSPTNTDLSTQNTPAVATIAPFWDDLEIVGPEAAVYWDVQGSGSDQQLVIQFHKVRFWGSPEPGDISFQVILSEGDGTIRVNYLDLDSEQPGAGGTSATVGIKDVSDADYNPQTRLLLSYDEGPNDWVGSQQSTMFGLGLTDPSITTPDYYEFTLGENERATLALEQFGGNVDVELVDSTGDVIASGQSGPSNLDEVLDFDGGAAGTYYAKVTGATRTSYRLFVTRNAHFETENNSGPEPWNGVDPSQSISLDVNGGATVLGHIGGAGGGEAVVGYFTDFSTGSTAPEAAILAAGYLPVHITDISTFDFSTIDVLMFNESNNNGPSDEVIARLNDIQVAVEQDGLVFMVNDRFVSDDAGDPQSNPFLLGAPGILVDRDFADGADIDVIPPGDTLVINGPGGTIENETLDGGNYSNHGYVVGESLSTAPGITESILSAGQDVSHVVAFSYELGIGSVYYSTIPLDFYLYGDNNFNTIYAPNMLAYGYSLSNPEVDFYQVQIPTLENGGTLSLSTLIPAIGLGQPVNELNPMIWVYDASGNLLISNDDGGEHGNAAVDYFLPPGSPASYYIQVSTSESRTVEATRGTYVLSVDLTEAPPPPGITVNKAQVVTGEPDVTDTFTVVLNTKPSGNVTIPIASGDTTEALLSTGGAPQTAFIDLIFTPENWSTPQQVTVHGQDDFVADGDKMYLISLDPADSTDGEYNGLDATDVSGINTDNDLPGITVSPTSGLVTYEDPGISDPEASFTLVLDAEPADTVTIVVTSNDTTEALVSANDQGPADKVQLTFTPSDWTTPQTVFLSGQDDGLDDGHTHYLLMLDASTSSDGNYAALPPVLVTATNRDDDDDPLTEVELDYYEDGNINEYGSSGNDTLFSVTAAAARDGDFGLEGGNGNDWIHRNDDQVQVSRGDVFSTWIRADGSPSGRAYFGFGAKTKGKPSSRGALSLVMAANSNQLMLQRNVEWGFEDIDVVPQTWVADTWYRFEVEWHTDGNITGRLYNTEGELINAVEGADINFSSGGIAFRNFGSVRHFDTVELRTGVATPSAASVGRDTAFAQLLLASPSQSVGSIVPAISVRERDEMESTTELSQRMASVQSVEITRQLARRFDTDRAFFGNLVDDQKRPATEEPFAQVRNDIGALDLDEALLDVLANDVNSNAR
jgi:subtilisin family serine protease